MNEKDLVDEVVQELYRKLCCQKQTFLTIGVSKQRIPESLKDRYHFVDELTLDQKIDGVLIYSLDLSMLTNLAHGLATNGAEEEVRLAFLENKPVFIYDQGIQYHNYKSTSKKAFYNLLMEYEDKLYQYGAKKILTLEELLLFGEEKEGPTKTENKGQKDAVTSFLTKNDFTNRKLILEKDLVGMRSLRGITMVVDQNCIITPMAQDFILNHHIKIERI